MIFILLPTNPSSTLNTTLYLKLQKLSTLAATLLSKQIVDETYEGRSCNMKYIHKCNAMAMMWKMIAYDINMCNTPIKFSDLVAKYDIVNLTQCFNKQMGIADSRDLLGIYGYSPNGAIPMYNQSDSFYISDDLIVINPVGGLFATKATLDCQLQITE
jgi:hypothetical protein